jgi:hypothetical protein
MRPSSKARRIGLLTALALTITAAPAFADDADGAKTTKKPVAHQHKAKAEKPKGDSMKDKDTTSQYPPTQVPGSGY